MGSVAVVGWGGSLVEFFFFSFFFFFFSFVRTLRVRWEYEGRKESSPGSRNGQKGNQWPVTLLEMQSLVELLICISAVFTITPLRDVEDAGNHSISLID